MCAKFVSLEMEWSHNTPNHFFPYFQCRLASGYCNWLQQASWGLWPVLQHSAATIHLLHTSTQHQQPHLPLNIIIIFRTVNINIIFETIINTLINLFLINITQLSLHQVPHNQPPRKAPAITYNPTNNHLPTIIGLVPAQCSATIAEICYCFYCY